MSHFDDSVEIALFPGNRDKIRIKQSRIPIESSGPEKFEELEQIYQQIKSLRVVPDFGYEGEDSTYAMIEDR